jgi:hypothetical protein
MSGAATHPPVETWLDYWLHDTAPASTDAIDEHLMQCDACGHVLDGLIALGDGVREAFRAGTVGAMTTAAFVQRLAGEGLRIREYRVPANGSVDCTVAPEDELLVSHLEAPLAGVKRLDAVARVLDGAQPQHRFEDIPFDPRSDRVVQVQKLDVVRAMPAHTYEVTLLAVEPAGERELGGYVIRHRPWPGSAPAQPPD